MTKEKFMIELQNCKDAEKVAILSAKMLDILEQQNTALQQERSNMQATHQSTIESYRKEIAELQARIEELEAHKTRDWCKHHGEQSDDGWGVCSNLGSWLYLEETPSHATCQYYEQKQN